MERTLEGLHKKYYVDVEYVNVADRSNREQIRALRNQYEVRGTPTLIFFNQEGEHIWTRRGATTESVIVSGFSRRNVRLERR